MSERIATILDRFCDFEASQPNELLFAEPVAGRYHYITWGEAGKEVRRMAAALQKMGLGKDDKVAILSKNCAHWIMADLAIAMAGCVCVPLYPNITPAALREIMEHSETKLVFAGKLDNADELRKGIPDGLTSICFPFYPHAGCLAWDSVVAGQQGITGKPDIAPHALACIVYTSGTTGQPKGVMHTFHAMGFAVDAFLKSYPALSKEILFSYLPLCHVAERMLVECGAIFTGSTVYFVESLDTFARNLAHTRPTVFLAVPRIWEKIQENILLKLPQRKLNRLLSIPLVSTLVKYMIRRKLGLDRAKAIFSGASPINVALLKWYAKLGIVIQEAYGMTENIALSHSNRIGAVKFGTVGQPYDGVYVRLGKDNEVQVKSEASMLGYYKEPEMSAASFEDGYLRTGDEGSIDAEGYLTITGRIKDQFKTSKGKYIMPAPMEGKLLSSALVGQVCVAGSGMQSALALCNLSEHGKKHDQATLADQLKALLRELNQTLEPHERLSHIIVVAEEWTIENGLLTPTLKIKRKMIDERFGKQYETWGRHPEPVVFAM